jgi:FHA domain/Double zinc ribbon
MLCPHCQKSNSPGAEQCVACHQSLRAGAIAGQLCPNCGSSQAAAAAFCGQCGVRAAVIEPDVLAALAAPPRVEPLAKPVNKPGALYPPARGGGIPFMVDDGDDASPMPTMRLDQSPHSMPPRATPIGSIARPKLLHVQTDTLLELPPGQTMVHFGKPNDRVPPEFDVSGYPNSEIVSRVHAGIRIEGTVYYVEDLGSSNGTYINNAPLEAGTRYRLRDGDRIALGKGDKVSFLFQE